MFIFKGGSKFMSDFEKSTRKFKNQKQFSTKPILTQHSTFIWIQEIETEILDRPKKSLKRNRYSM